jgi:hypothetical protein
LKKAESNFANSPTKAFKSNAAMISVGFLANDYGRANINFSACKKKNIVRLIHKNIHN